MGNTSRTYSDPSFGSKKTMFLPATGSLVGTGAGTEVGRLEVMEDCIATDWNLVTVVGGTTGAVNVLIGKSLAGTGAFTAFGTVAIGTNASNVVIDAACTETTLNIGDHLVCQWAGTSAMTTNVIPRIQYRETFVTGSENG